MKVLQKWQKVSSSQVDVSLPSLLHHCLQGGHGGPHYPLNTPVCSRCAAQSAPRADSTQRRHCGVAITGSLEEGWKHCSVHYFPLRFHSNDTMTKHLSECPRSKFQERFACHISIRVREGKLGRLLGCRGIHWVLKPLIKIHFWESSCWYKVTPHFVLHSPELLPHSPAGGSLRTVCPCWGKVKKKP